MPDLAELMAVLVLAAVTALVVARPWLGRAWDAPAPLEVDTLVLRHRLALEAVRDVEADRRAGSLDDAAYASQRAEAEAHALGTLARLQEARSTGESGRPAASSGWRPAAVVGLVLAGLLVVGFALPAPVGLANPTVENVALAEAQAAEAARQARIAQLERQLSRDARDAEALSQLADAYLAGDSSQDLVRAALLLLGLIGLEPENESAYARLIGAYVRAGDYLNAAAATDALAEIAPDAPDVAFFRGLIALRGDNDPVAAIEAFDRFVERAPDDPRVPMVRGLRAEAQAEAQGEAD